MAICDALDRIAKLYQIPNYDFTVNSMLLAEWILDEYKHHQLELVLETLRKPPILNDQAWRLTPDTLKNWIDLKRIERANLKERQESLKRQSEPVKEIPKDEKERIDLLIEEFKAKLSDGFKNSTSGWQYVAEKIKEEDKNRLKGKSVIKSESIGIHYTSLEQSILFDKRQEWMKECYDIITGKPNDRWMSFEEWIKL